MTLRHPEHPNSLILPSSGLEESRMRREKFGRPLARVASRLYLLVPLFSFACSL
jgi:hypothetical protein